MKGSRKFACLILALLVGAGQAMAEQSCSAWMDQGDGTSWTTCVDENGTQRCYRVNNTPGSTVFEVSCSQ
ncbi:hypothetical protein OU426_06675 [Frigidibacter sp. RF13]|uniref:hypothetical protein n=1 Tax=Frigidibacter sp. RF13 TaxID=2997340 RepID=UPI00226D96EB|nr:hypothetical protein [Frigidibacter sp. RF13]MCY1126532.1 hypothetical protein [Frigidibacter sp. RF13]